ncbi:CoA transferase subunit A [Bacillus sp. ISL-101]|uniref:CoA transferase subunit A n=1 Tax=unclassified Bacillus (in: firmicutes) TaxID=185979 RepID=UPI001BEAAF6A|nr:MULTISPECIES: CoA transferase subunit A [unclassified Bacillus (in: firmicutes)]MBT2630784.1 CoA transferase subunit A [Bacillus sp. ISL-101]MBT2716564.1 CoA transferase subunit A [Bacillus sp. ISL-57]
MENTFQKICRFEDVRHHFKDKQSILFGGFGGIGTPPGLINVILESGIKDLTLIGNDTGFPGIGIGKLVTQRRAKKVIVSHIGSNPYAGLLMNNGELEVEFCPQGTLVERIRAGGMGLGGILTDIGMEADIVRDGKQTVKLGKKNYLVESALTADIAIVYAEMADPYGNLLFDKSARNTNPIVAAAGQITIVEVRQIVPLGTLDPENIIVPGAFVDYIIPSKGVDWKWVWEQGIETE